jgi:hypothetical protein
MGDLKTTTQRTDGSKSGDTPNGEPGSHNTGAEFGTRDPATAGTNRDADRSGESMNEGHSHPRDQHRG